MEADLYIVLPKSGRIASPKVGAVITAPSPSTILVDIDRYVSMSKGPGHSRLDCIYANLFSILKPIVVWRLQSIRCANSVINAVFSTLR